MKRKLDYTYHCHTYRCGHASGKDEEYVLAALEAGFKTLGFSDHVILPDFAEPGMRGDPEELEGYFSSLRELERKYEKDIDIYVGFECEYFDGDYLEYYRKLKDEKVDYLILGEHGHIENGEFVFYCRMEDKEVALEHYVSNVVSAIESGLFAYVAHPDYFCYFYREWDDKAVEAAKRIFRAAEKYGIPLEINMCQSHWPRFYGKTNYDYPNDKFWELAKNYRVKAIFGVDAHLPNHILSVPFPFYLAFAEKHGLEIIEKLPISKRK
ncbi:MAG: histidinol-phosphatase [Bacilli bacterium]|nr:histidinol-phosphatase [Bacilli bacterium]